MVAKGLFWWFLSRFCFCDEQTKQNVTSKGKNRRKSEKVISKGGSETRGIYINKVANMLKTRLENLLLRQQVWGDSTGIDPVFIKGAQKKISENNSTNAFRMIPDY